LTPILLQITQRTNWALPEGKTCGSTLFQETRGGWSQFNLLYRGKNAHPCRYNSQGNGWKGREGSNVEKKSDRPRRSFWWFNHKCSLFRCCFTLFSHSVAW
jgi:hypothetical protein